MSSTSRVLGLGGLLLTIVLFSGVGCKQYYNGAFGVGLSDAELVKEYHRNREQRLIEEEKAQATYVKPVTDPKTINTDPGTIQPPVPALPTSEPVMFPNEDEILRPTLTQSHGGIQPYSPPQQYVSTDTAGAPTYVPPKPISIYGNMPGGQPAMSPLDSTGQLRRISFTDEGADFDVTLDSTGEYLLYSSTRHRQTSDIYSQRIDGSAITQLTDDSSNDVMPMMSPDGKTITFASDRSGNWDIYLMDAKGGPAVQLTSDRTHDIHPSFSPDGKRLVYCSLSERSGQWQLVTIDIDNPTTKRYIGHGLFPEWSPSGDTILYQRARERGTRWFSVWTVELDERGEAGSPTEIIRSSAFACITPSWSPDGKAVVFCTVTNPDADTQGGRPAESDVWISRVDGSGRTRLTRGRFANLQPAWSGDKAIYFVSNRATGGAENIWAIDPDDAIKVAFQGSKTSDTQTADVPTDND